jgi:hypothetical protein
MILRVYNRAKLVVLALALVAVTSVSVYEFGYAMPKARCERMGLLWAAKWRSCAKLVDLSILTGRPNHPAPPPGVTPPPQTIAAPTAASVPLPNGASKNP